MHLRIICNTYSNASRPNQSELSIPVRLGEQREQSPHYVRVCLQSGSHLSKNASHGDGEPRTITTRTIARKAPNLVQNVWPFCHPIVIWHAKDAKVTVVRLLSNGGRVPRTLAGQGPPYTPNAKETSKPASFRHEMAAEASLRLEEHNLKAPIRCDETNVAVSSLTEWDV